MGDTPDTRTTPTPLTDRVIEIVEEFNEDRAVNGEEEAVANLARALARTEQRSDESAVAELAASPTPERSSDTGAVAWTDRPDTRTTENRHNQIVQALRDVFENEFGGVLSIHWNGTIGLTPMDAAERLADPLLIQMEHHAVPDTRTTESPHSLHDPQHAYWCAVPWCPQYVRNHIPAEAAQGAAPRAEGLDLGLLTTAIHTADPTYGPDGIGHNPMCEKRAEKIAAAYLKEQQLRSRPAEGAAPRAEGLDERQLFDPLSDEVGRFVARWAEPEQRADAIEDTFRLLQLAREYPFDRDWVGPPYTRPVRLSERRDTETEPEDVS